MKNQYLAFVLDDSSRNELIRLFKPSFSRVICHHVTIDFNITPENLTNQYNELLNGSNNTVKAIGIGLGDGVECVAVAVNGHAERTDGSFYHITLSVEPPHKPVESNKLKDKVNLIRGFVNLTGSFQLLQK